MKVKDLFDVSLEIDVDVYENIADLIGIAYCSGNKLTEAGKRKFKTALQFPIQRIDRNMLVIDTERYFKEKNINIDDYDFEWNIPPQVQNLIDLFWSVAGYCSIEDYEKWFIDK
jgi:hypothetical protein